ncbi:nucleotide-sugar transporter-domain-containing protein [Hyaloraphidium curvatum]|nr:nucleotide-sugar transporter-domain-containing protein [Hyaloraphidium curvatum]
MEFRISVWLKPALVGLLVAQNVSLIVVLHETRNGKGEVYLASAAVVIAELLKLFAWIAIACMGSGYHVLISFVKAQFRVGAERLATVRMILPSGLYVVQSNLLYFALTHLDPVTYQLTSQSKILTTAVFMVLILGRRLSLLQWSSLILLMGGICMVQYSSQSHKWSDSKHHSTALGMIAVLLAATTSGFSGVYLEKVFKGGSKSPPSEGISGLTANNLRLAFISLCVSCLVLAYEISSDPQRLFKGWHSWVYFVVLNSAVGGVLVALVIKHLDNIVKTFAMTLSIVLSGLLCEQPEHQDSRIWWTGAALVVFSIVVYHYLQ